MQSQTSSLGDTCSPGRSASPPSEEDRKPPAVDPKNKASLKNMSDEMQDWSSKEETSEDQDMQDSATSTTAQVSTSAAAAAAATAAAASGGPTSGESQQQTASHAFDQMENVDLPAFVKAHKGTLTFPEKLMLMLIHIEGKYAREGWRIEKAPIAWTKNGRAFAIRDNDKLVSEWLPIFFQRGKFSSFKRKLYRWGFRQVQMVNHDLTTIGSRELVFGNENFQRDQKILLPRMKSVTAESVRRQQASAQKVGKGRVTAAARKETPAAQLPGKNLELVSRPATEQSRQDDAASLQTLTSLLLLPSQRSVITGLLQSEAAAVPLPPPSPPPVAGSDLGGFAAALSAFNPSLAAAATPSESQALRGLLAAQFLRGDGNNSPAAAFTQTPHSLPVRRQQPSPPSDTTSAAPATDSTNPQATAGVGLVSELLRGADNTTLQQVVNILQEQQQRQRQEAMVKNIQRLLLQQHQQTAPQAPPSAPASDALLALLLLQQLGGGSGGGSSNNAGP